MSYHICLSFSTSCCFIMIKNPDLGHCLQYLSIGFSPQLFLRVVSKEAGIGCFLHSGRTISSAICHEFYFLVEFFLSSGFVSFNLLLCNVFIRKFLVFVLDGWKRCRLKLSVLRVLMPIEEFLFRRPRYADYSPPIINFKCAHYSSLFFILSIWVVDFYSFCGRV